MYIVKENFSPIQETLLHITYVH